MKTEVKEGNEKSAVTEIQLEIRLVLENIQNMIHHSVNRHAFPTLAIVLRLFIRNVFTNSDLLTFGTKTSAQEKNIKPTSKVWYSLYRGPILCFMYESPPTVRVLANSHSFYFEV